MNNSKTFFKFTILSFLLFSFSSCMTSPESLLSQLYGPIFSDQPISRQIYAKPTKDENQLLKFFISKFGNSPRSVYLCMIQTKRIELKPKKYESRKRKNGVGTLHSDR